MKKNTIFMSLLMSSMLLVAGRCKDQKEEKRIKLNVANPAALAMSQTSLRTSSAPVFVSIINNGERTLRLDSFSITPANNVFTIDAASSSCRPGLSLATNETCEISVTFSPVDTDSYVGSLDVYYAAPNSHLDQQRLVSFSLTGSGVLDCSVDEEFSGAVQAGRQRAAETNLEEARAGQLAAEAKTFEDGYNLNYPVGYNQTYTENFNAAYAAAYTPAYNTAYDQNEFDSATCADAEFDALDDAFLDADNDAFIDGTEDGDNDGYGDGYADGVDFGIYDDGYFDGQYACLGDDADVLFNLSSNSVQKERTSEYLSTCELRGFNAAYQPGVFEESYALNLPLNEEYQNGKEQGLATGRADGVTAGTAEGNVAGAREGAEDGRIVALDDRYTSCYEARYTSEYNYVYDRNYDGYYDDAYALAYTQGESDAYADGYNDGYDDADFEYGCYDGAYNEFFIAELEKDAIRNAPKLSILSQRAGMTTLSSNGMTVDVSNTQRSKQGARSLISAGIYGAPVNFEAIGQVRETTRAYVNLYRRLELRGLIPMTEASRKLESARTDVRVESAR